MGVCVLAHWHMTYIEVEEVHLGDDEVEEICVDALLGDGEWVHVKRAFQRFEPLVYFALSFLWREVGDVVFGLADLQRA